MNESEFLEFLNDNVGADVADRAEHLFNEIRNEVTDYDALKAEYDRGYTAGYGDGYNVGAFRNTDVN